MLNRLAPKRSFPRFASGFNIRFLTKLFKNRLAAMPKVIEFGEFATKDKSSVAGLDDEGLKIAATVNK